MIQFSIADKGEISRAFLAKGITTFEATCSYVKSLPYARNSNKDDVFTVFTDDCGTCGTKHALLKRLADENSIEGLELITGIYKMDGSNTPGVGPVLEKYGLEYIPEAHNYLKWEGRIFDYTFPHVKTTGFNEELLEETVITPEQISAYKVELHKNYLTRWLISNKRINLPLGRLWEIREECIAALSRN